MEPNQNQEPDLSLEELMLLFESTLVNEFNKCPLPISVKAMYVKKFADQVDQEYNSIMNKAHAKLNERASALQNQNNEDMNSFENGDEPETELENETKNKIEDTQNPDRTN